MCVGGEAERERETERPRRAQGTSVAVSVLTQWLGSLFALCHRAPWWPWPCCPLTEWAELWVMFRMPQFFSRFPFNYIHRRVNMPLIGFQIVSAAQTVEAISVEATFLEGSVHSGRGKLGKGFPIDLCISRLAFRFSLASCESMLSREERGCPCTASETRSRDMFLGALKASVCFAVSFGLWTPWRDGHRGVAHEPGT